MDKAITLNPDVPPDELKKIVLRAEQVGYTHCYVADQGFSRDVYVTLSMLACSTHSIRLGPGITHPYTRHAAVTAISIATLDEVSGGRAFLGLGAGGSRSLVPMQIERSKPMEMCRETVEICRALWKDKTVDFSGEFFHLANARPNFSSRNNIEVHWAARGPKMLALGGEIADVSILHAIPDFELGNVVQRVQEGARRAGRIPKLQYAVTHVFDDVSRQSARERTVYRLVDSSEAVKKRLGLNEATITEMRNRVTTQGLRSAAYLVSDDILCHYTLEGSPEECAKKLRPLVEVNGLTGITFEVHSFPQAAEIIERGAQILSMIERR
jgi:5,10-methylenetetrahydromethanopterin reductase